jgi:hypothetical protein
VCSPRHARGRDVDGECLLNARGAVVTRDAPIARTLNWNSDVLAIRNFDRADWRNLEVTIYGFETTRAYGKRPTGRYHAKKGFVSAGELIAFNASEFESESESRWISKTMNVELVELQASLRGESCRAEITPSSASEVAGR